MTVRGGWSCRSRELSGGTRRRPHTALFVMGRVNNIVGSLPFGGGRGVPRKGRVLSLSKQTLTHHQAMSESAHAQQLFRWLGFWSKFDQRLAHTYHVANEHNGSTVTRVDRQGRRVVYCASGAKRRAEGVKPGILDLANHAAVTIETPCLVGRDGEVLTVTVEEYSGLFIELKVGKHQLTNDREAEWDQTRELEWLRSQSKSAHVCWSWVEAAALHLWYFDINRRDAWQSLGKPELFLLPRIGGHDKRCGCDLKLNEMRKGFSSVK